MSNNTKDCLTQGIYRKLKHANESEINSCLLNARQKNLGFARKGMAQFKDKRRIFFNFQIKGRRRTKLNSKKGKDKREEKTKREEEEERICHLSIRKRKEE